MAGQVIGRVAADPDFLPRRSKDFGLDEGEFLSRFCDSCPRAFFKVACLCCNTNPDLRSDSGRQHRLWPPNVLASVSYSASLRCCALCVCCMVHCGCFDAVVEVRSLRR